jgi:hypothetical protein
VTRLVDYQMVLMLEPRMRPSRLNTGTPWKSAVAAMMRSGRSGISTGNLPHGYGNGVIKKHLLQDVFRIGDSGENIIQSTGRYTFLLDEINHFGKAYSRNADVVAAGDSRIDKS